MQKAAEKPARPHVSRVKLMRILEMQQLMGEGKLTITQIVEAKKGVRGWSYRSIENLIHSPEWEVITEQFREGSIAILQSLVSKQLKQIETSGLPPAVQLAWRQRMIEIFQPKVVKQEVSGQLSQNVNVEQPLIDVKAFMEEYGGVLVDEVMRRKLNEDTTPGEEKPDERKTDPDQGA
jgi:hypothetical protein